ncbi:hypothetical protein FXO37_22645 [Capsicum annuum]|nr:hypothetical protein FXO37_22645 [Capsicum annuum]
MMRQDREGVSDLDKNERNEFWGRYLRSQELQATTKQGQQSLLLWPPFSVVAGEYVPGRDLPPPNDDDRHNHLIRAHRNTGQRGLNKEVMDMQESLQKEKAVGKSLLESGRGAYDRVCESPIIKGLSLSQLEQLKEALESQKRKVEFEAELQQMGSDAPLPFLTFGSALSPTSGDGESSSHKPNVGAPFPN